MTKRVRLDDEAAEELDAAAVWYEARRPSLGIEFLALVRDALARLAETPRAWPFVRNVPARLGVRSYALRRFPYAIVYLELEDELRIVAIAHGSRQPGFWRGRL